MQTTLLLIAVFFVQEGTSASIVLLQALTDHTNVWLIHFLWLATTTFEICLGYMLGTWIQKRFASTKFEKWLKMQFEKIEKLVSTRGEKVTLAILSLAIFPGAAAFFASWLNISFRSMFTYVLIGDVVWYAGLWATTLGLQHATSNFKEGALLILGFSILVAIASRLLRKRNVS